MGSDTGSHNYTSCRKHDCGHPTWDPIMPSFTYTSARCLRLSSTFPFHNLSSVSGSSIHVKWSSHGCTAYINPHPGFREIAHIYWSLWWMFPPVHNVLSQKLPMICNKYKEVPLHYNVDTYHYSVSYLYWSVHWGLILCYYSSTWENGSSWLECPVYPTSYVGISINYTGSGSFNVLIL